MKERKEIWTSAVMTRREILWKRGEMQIKLTEWDNEDSGGKKTSTKMHNRKQTNKQRRGVRKHETIKYRKKIMKIF